MRKKIGVVRAGKGRGSGRYDKKITQDTLQSKNEAERNTARGPERKRNKGEIQRHIIASQGTNEREANTQWLNWPFH